MVKKTANPSSLSVFVNRSDGIDVEEALKRADLHLMTLRDTVNNGIGDSIGAIGVLVGAANGGMPADQRQELHQLSDGILSVAGLFEKEALGKAAHSLCDLLEVFKTEGRWDAGAIRLHYDAMRLLQASPDLPPDAQVELVSGLEKVVRALSANHPIHGVESGTS